MGFEIFILEYLENPENPENPLIPKSRKSLNLKDRNPLSSLDNF